MKKLFALILLVSPWIVSSQDANPLIFESTTMTPLSGNVLQFESAVAAHNKKYHATGPHGVRVYSIASGVNSGKYQWVMGPGHWSDLDTRPDDEDNHNLDWTTNVVPNLTTEAKTIYIKLDRTHSHFGHDFDVSKIYFWYWDIVPNADWVKVNGLLDKITNVYKTKLPDDIFGVYNNELLSTSEGKDIIMAFFFPNYAWMGTDNGFDKKYEEIYGKDSWKTFLTDWNSQVKAVESEIWEFRDDLSGLNSKVIAAERQ